NTLISTTMFPLNWSELLEVKYLGIFQAISSVKKQLISKFEAELKSKQNLNSNTIMTVFFENCFDFVNNINSNINQYIIKLSTLQRYTRQLNVKFNIFF